MSPAFTEDDVHAERYPGVKALGELRWSRVDTDYDGVLPIDKFRAKKLAGVWQDNSHEMVWLKATIQADASTTRLLEFDFSNKVILYLNGRPLFAGAAPWNSKLGYAFGSIAWGANGVYLPLRRGDNELLAAVISESDGWGIMARFDSAEGIALR